MWATLQYCTLYGIMAVAVTPNLMLAAVLSSGFYSMWNLFAGFIIPKPVCAALHACDRRLPLPLLLLPDQGAHAHTVLHMARSRRMQAVPLELLAGSQQAPAVCCRA